MMNKKLKKMFGIGALVLLFGAGIISYEKKVWKNKAITEFLINNQLKMPKRLGINVGDYWGYFFGYSGMNNEKTFSVYYNIGSGANAINVYYPINSKEIKIREDKFKVIEVTPKHIILDYLGESEKKK